MKKIKTIAWYDWVQLKRSKPFWPLTVIFICISIYAAWYGNNEVQQQQRKIVVIKDSIDKNMNLLQQQLQLHDSVAWEYEPLYKTLFYNKPDGMAALSFGQRDLHKFAIEISEGTYYYNKYATGYTNKTLSAEINNPQKQLAGHLDMSFVIIFLLPLYFILLSYNLLSSEKEQGTLSILGVQPVSIAQVFFAKLFVRWFASTLLSIAVLLLAGAITGALTDGRLWLLIAATFLYSLVWAGFVTVVTGLKKSSGFNALLLICSWLFFCILLPASFNAILKVKYPTANKTQLTAAVQKANSAVFEMPRMVVADSFYKIHPQYNNKPGDTLPNGWYNPRWMRSVHAVLDSKVEPIEKQYHQLLQQRMQATSKLNYASPALLSQSIFNSAGASDMNQMLAYDTASWHYFKKWNSYLDDRIFFNENKFTKKDFEKLPQYVFKPVIDYPGILYKLVMLLAWSAVLFLLGWRLLRQLPGTGNKKI